MALRLTAHRGAVGAAGLPEGTRLWVGGPLPPGADAITLGSLVIVRRGSADSERLLRHEGVHVQQWRRWGVVGFLRRYLGAYVRWRLRGYGHRAAYERIPLEVEAFWWGERALERAFSPPEGAGNATVAPDR